MTVSVLAPRYMIPLPTGTVTFLFTDIEGSTALLRQLGRDGYERALAEHAEILKNPPSTITAVSLSTRKAIPSSWPFVRRGMLSRRPFPGNAGSQHMTGRMARRSRCAWACIAESRRRAANATSGSACTALPESEVPLTEARYCCRHRHASSSRTTCRRAFPCAIWGSYWLKDIDRPERISQVMAEGLQAEFPPLRDADPIAAHSILRRRLFLVSTVAGVLVAAAAVAIAAFVLERSSGVAHAAALVRLDPTKAKVTGGIRVPGQAVGCDHVCGERVRVQPQRLRLRDRPEDG